MILEVMSLGFLFLGTVQSAVISAEYCPLMSSDFTCSGAVFGECTDLCADNDCDSSTCDQLAIQMAMIGMTNWGECYSVMGYDQLSSCEDDGSGGCDGDVKMCATVSPTTSSGECGGVSFDTPVDLSAFGDLACDDYLPTIPFLFPGFTGYCECFTVNATYDMMLNCGSGSCSDTDTGSSTDNTMMIGIVVGVVVVVVIIVAVICMRSRRKL